MKIALIFPPGWNLNTGSPHLGLPMLAGSLERAGFDIVAKDANWEMVNSYLKIGMSFDEIEAAHVKSLVSKDTDKKLECLNKPYFRVEDKLQIIAGGFGANWNIQTGFSYKHFSSRSSSEVLAASSLDSPFAKYFHTICKWIRDENPSLIALSIASPGQLIPAFQLCQIIRKEKFPFKIIMGGNVITRLWMEIMKAPDLFRLVDYLGIFQGDTTIVELAKAIRDDRSHYLQNIPNLIWKLGSSIYANPIQQIIPMNSLPTPSFQGFPVGKYWGVNYLPLNAGRGCYHGKCHFCSIPYGWNEKGFCGIRSARLVRDDMFALAEKHGISRFKFTEESMPPYFMKKLAALLEKPFQWEAYAIMEPKFTEKNFLDNLAQGGCRKLYFGLETLSKKGRKAMGKRGLIDPLKLLRMCHDAGIKTHLFTMVGFPGTGQKEAESTIEFILKHQDIVDTVDITPFKYARHTDVPGIKPFLNPGEDWALDFPYKPKRKGVLSEKKVKILWKKMDDILWNANPFFRHPIYRLLSPWR